MKFDTSIESSGYRLHFSFLVAIQMQVIEILVTFDEWCRMCEIAGVVERAEALALPVFMQRIDPRSPRRTRSGNRWLQRNPLHPREDIY